MAKVWLRITEKRIEKLVEHYSPFLGIGHHTYNIILSDARTKDNRWMLTNIESTFEHFTITVYANYLEKLIHREGWDLRDEVSVTVIHELIHVTFQRFEGLIHFASPESERMYEWEQEPVIERYARLLYNHLPKVTE